MTTARAHIGMITAVLAFPANSSANGGANGIASSLPPGDVVCGPRCVVEILHRFDQDEDLIDIVRETQWPRIEQGASFASLRHVLDARGIYTAALRLSPDADLVWPYPVLIHLRPNAGADLGHYVVWLPDSPPGEVRLWSGLSGIEVGSLSEFARRRSDVVLLTSPTPIVRPNSAVRRRSILREPLLWDAGGFAALCAATWLGGRMVHALFSSPS